MRIISFVWLGMLAVEWSPITARQTTYNPSTEPLRQVHENMNQMKHRLSNHESELHQIEEKFSSVEAMLDVLRRQQQEQSRGHKEQLDLSRNALEAKLSDLEFMAKGVALDMQQIKNRLNESTELLTYCKQEMNAFEKVVEVQNQNIENLQAAMKTLMQLLQGSENGEMAFDQYIVQPGDSLGKIAHLQGTTIKTLKELNHLGDSNRIKVGQKIKIPVK